MAKVVFVRSNAALRQQVEQEREVDTVMLSTAELRSLLCRAEKFETMRVTLRASGWKGLPDLELPRLIGTCQTLERLLESSISDMTWPVWAHLRLGRGGEPFAADHVELRRALGDKLDELSTWITWANELYQDHIEAITPEPETARRWIWSMVRRGHHAETQEARAKFGKSLAEATQQYEGYTGAPTLAPPADDGWFRWAVQALGLSDAYVEDQKLTTDDLRRMISERL
jgi:hypothetical protein